MFVQLQYWLPQHLLSRIVGLVANSRVRWIKQLFIRIVIKRYQVDVSEAASENLDDYASFNAFFTRRLKPGIRPIVGTPCSPADGAVSASGQIRQGQIFQAKGIDYSLEKLLASSQVTAYEQGSFITVYLSPKDYHRVHCPVDCTLTTARYVPGKLFSVNQTTAENVPDLFADNERLVMEFDTEQGRMAVVMVGAMIVAAIQPVWRSEPYKAKTFVEELPVDTQFKAGDELGAFQMGSTAIVLFERPVNWRQSSGDLVKMGQALTTPSPTSGSDPA